jgi:hypothetical protein
MMPMIRLTIRIAPPRVAIRVYPWLGVASAALGLAAITVGLLLDPVRTWSNVLIDGFVVLSIPLGGLVFTAVHHLSGASWSAGMRRVAEAMMAVLPMAALIMLGVFLGRGSLYAWASSASLAAHELGTPQASPYFAAPAVFSRMVLFLSLWAAFALLIRRASALEDSDPDPVHHQRSIRYSAVFVVVFAVTFSLAAVDWLLTIDAKWTSTIFAVYVLAGLLVEAFAAVTLAVVLLQQGGHLRGTVTIGHLHDLGKLLLALTTFWAYIWLSQYLLVWYANLPEEIGYYQLRTGPVWMPWFLANVVVNWVVPFLALLPRTTKRDPETLKWVAVLILLGRWLDVYLLVAPQTMRTPALGLLELTLAIASGGFAWDVVSRALARRPLVVRHDPRLDERVRRASLPC